MASGRKLEENCYGLRRYPRPKTTRRRLTFAPFARAHPVVLARGRVAAHRAELRRGRGRHAGGDDGPRWHAAGDGVLGRWRWTLVVGRLRGHGQRVDAVPDLR